MMPMNNPVLELLAAMRRGANPQAMIEQLAMQNPQAGMVAQMLRGKTPQQQEQLVRNVARERRVDLNGLMRQMGLRQ